MDLYQLSKEIDGILIEATLNVDKDVDFLYKVAGFDKIAKAVKSGNAKELEAAIDFSHKEVKVPSSALKSKVSVKANKVNPITIRIGGNVGGNYYNMVNHTIGFGVSENIAWVLRDNDYDMEKVMKDVGDQGRAIRNDLLAPALKGSIAHELNHWIKDSLHGGFMLGAVQSYAKKRAKGKGVPNVNQTSFEIDSQVEAIRYIKRELGKRAFDKLSWEELAVTKPSLASNFIAWGRLTHAQFDDVMKLFIKRMARENLLGKGLRKKPNYSAIRLAVGSM